MTIVYVQNIDGTPLMPTMRCGHVRILLKQGKAKVINRKPFTIRLLYNTPDVTHPLFLGINPGRTNIGLCVINDKGDEVFTAQAETRNKDIPKLMLERKANRLKHRHYGRRTVKRRRACKAGTVKADTFERILPGCEKPIVLHDIRNKESRFNNRKRPDGWLTPTATHLLRTHINLVKMISKILPITDVILELNSFAFMAMDDPDIRRWDYQRGQLYGYKGSVEAAVDAQQDGHCIFCDSKIEHYHHIIPRHKGGSNTLPNIAGLCKCHHDLVHTDKTWVDKLLKLKDGLNKKYGALSVLNQITVKLANELVMLYPGHVYCTSGKDTKRYRETYGLTKDHWLDAYCIASLVVGNDARCGNTTVFKIKQFRRHNRQACHQEMMNRKYKLDNKIVAVNRRKAYEQESDSLSDYRDKLAKEVGPDATETIISKLTVQEHHARLKNTKRYLPGSIFFDKKQGGSFILQGSNGFHNGTADYYVDVCGMKHLASKCKFIQNNKGLQFVG